MFNITGLLWEKSTDWRVPQTVKLMGPTWGPPGSYRPQMGPMLVPWTLLSQSHHKGAVILKVFPCYNIIIFISPPLLPLTFFLPQCTPHKGLPSPQPSISSTIKCSPDPGAYMALTSAIMSSLRCCWLGSLRHQNVHGSQTSWNTWLKILEILNDFLDNI